MDAKVKHVTMTCPMAGCTERAFVQVVIDPDAERRKKIDVLARKKLRNALTKAHKEGAHD